MNCGPLGFLSLHSISSLDWALFGRGPSPSYLAHVPFCPVSMGWLVLLPCHCIAPTMISPILVLPLSLQAEAPASPFFTFFLLLGFTGQHSCWASLFHALGFLGPFHSSGFLGLFSSSSLPLSLPWVFTKSFGLPWPNYHILTSYYLSSYPTNLLIHFLDFPGPFTSFLCLTIPIGLLPSFFGLPQPICFFLATYYFCGPVDHYSYHSSLLVFTLLFSLLIFFILLGFFCHWSLGPLVKSGHQQCSAWKCFYYSWIHTKSPSLKTINFCGF